jgi:hypothetical protein
MLVIIYSCEKTSIWHTISLQPFCGLIIPIIIQIRIAVVADFTYSSQTYFRVHIIKLLFAISLTSISRFYRIWEILRLVFLNSSNIIISGFGDILLAVQGFEHKMFCLAIVELSLFLFLHRKSCCRLSKHSSVTILNLRSVNQKPIISICYLCLFLLNKKLISTFFIVFFPISFLSLYGHSQGNILHVS